MAIVEHAREQVNEQVASRRINGLFVKGQSGNPGGRPKKPAEQLALERITREQASVALERLVGPALKVLDKAMKGSDEALAVRAAVDVLDRTQGRAIQRVDANVTNIDEVRRPNLELLQAAARRLLAASAVDASERQQE